MNSARLDIVGGDGQSGKSLAAFRATVAACTFAGAVAGFHYGAPVAAAVSEFWREVMLPVFVTLYLNGIALCT